MMRKMMTTGVLLAALVAFATPLHAESEKPVEELTVRVMTYNVCRGGTYWGQPMSQSAKMIELAQADIVGIQEMGKNTVPELAKLLGWNHTETFLTRYEIVEEFKGGGRRAFHGIVVKLPSGQEARVYSLHLPHGPYQPELLLGRTHPRYSSTIIKTEAEAIHNAKKNRGKHLARVLKPIAYLTNKEAPVFVIGDFNEPSHLDWTEAAAKAGRHPMKVDWPCSLMMAKAGFTDAYRTVHPDEMAKPGFTWSGAEPDVKPDDTINHSDRIDYVYFRGKGLKVTDAKVIGGNEENDDIVVSPYPSDHFAVVATIKLATPSGSEKPDADERNEIRWNVSNPILFPGVQGSFDDVSVKDPSVVFHKGKWHVFYTATRKMEHTTGYVSAEKVTDLQVAQRHELKMIRGKTRYGCAPQVLFYEPQHKWYLIFQNRDSNYQPVFSTTTTISRPDTWSDPAPLINKDTRRKWIDFWVICDETKAYLFYTEGHNGVMVRSTSLEAFPGGWGKSKKVYDDVHEAVHIYKVKDRKEYHMIYELNHGGIRSFGLARASHLEGPWQKVTDCYATGDQLRFGQGARKWTEMVSHGEVLRSGCNQQLEYDPNGCQWLIQGIMVKDKNGPYPSLPWNLGVITKSVKRGEQSPGGKLSKTAPQE